MKKIHTLFLLLIAVFTLNAQTTITLQPGAGTGAQNAHIDNLNQNSPNGAYPYINAGYNTVGGIPTLSHNFIRFDLSAIPAGATVTSAKFSLFHANGGNHSISSNNYEMLDRVLASWDPSTLTWNNQPNLSPTDTVQIGNTTTLTENKTDIDITSLVQGWVNDQNSNFGMAMLLVTEPGPIGNFQTYGSCNNTDSTTRPKLVVTYTACNGQLVLQPGPTTGKSSHIDDLNANQAGGTYPYINAGYNTVGGTPTLSHNFMQFDLSSIPAGATVTSAKFSLYHATGGSHSISSNNYEMLDMVTASWDAATMTWNNQPALSPTDTIQIGNTTTATESKPDIDVTRFAQYWVNNPGLNYGMAMRLVNEPGPIGNFQTYGSCNNADSTTWPKLVVEWVGCSTAVNEISNTTSQFSIYPNPANDILNIRDAHGELADLTIYDVTGRKIAEAYQVNKIATGTLQPGMYLLSIHSGKDINTYKFIKE